MSIFLGWLLSGVSATRPLPVDGSPWCSRGRFPVNPAGALPQGLGHPVSHGALFSVVWISALGRPPPRAFCLRPRCPGCSLCLLVIDPSCSLELFLANTSHSNSPLLIVCIHFVLFKLLCGFWTLTDKHSTFISLVFRDDLRHFRNSESLMQFKM